MGEPIGSAVLISLRARIAKAAKRGKAHFAERIRLLGEAVGTEA